MSDRPAGRGHLVESVVFGMLSSSPGPWFGISLSRHESMPASPAPTVHTNAKRQQARAECGGVERGASGRRRPNLSPASAMRAAFCGVRDKRPVDRAELVGDHPLVEFGLSRYITSSVISQRGSYSSSHGRILRPCHHQRPGRDGRRYRVGRHRTSQPRSSVDSRSYCIGVKDGLIRTLAPSFTAEEMEGAEIIDAE